MFNRINRQKQNNMDEIILIVICIIIPYYQELHASSFMCFRGAVNVVIVALYSACGPDH